MIGLIRFLPFEVADPGLGDVLVSFGFISAFYGVAIGITQRDPKAVLAYSSISQMGVIAVVLGMSASVGDQGAALYAAFYSAHHILVKGALFLTIGVAATISGHRQRLVLLFPAAVLALSLGGLPLTGGALAKITMKAPLGSGGAQTLATLSSVGTTLLMLHFLLRLPRGAQNTHLAASARLLWAWLAMAFASVLIPWLLYSAIGGDTAEALKPAALLEALWPVLSGALLAPGLWFWRHLLPHIPEGDIVVKEEAAFRASYGIGAALERMDLRLREWPAAGLSLMTIVLIIAGALSAQ